MRLPDISDIPEKAYEPIVHDKSTYADHISSVPLAVAGTKLDSLPNFDILKAEICKADIFSDVLSYKQPAVGKNPHKQQLNMLTSQLNHLSFYIQPLNTNS